jgi:hypothetical protein
MTEKPRWELTPEDWRTLIITFVGGVASIIVGAGLLGAALALAHWQTQGVRSGHWIGLVLSTVGIWTLTVGRLGFHKPKDRWDVLLTGSLALFAAILLLTWIGIAAGVK